MSRNVTDAPDPRQRFALYRLCDCPTCHGRGQVNERDRDGEMIERHRCPECRGEGRIRQELAACESPEAVGVAIVTLAREGEWETEDGQPCAFGLLDRMPPCEECGGAGWDLQRADGGHRRVGCHACKSSGVKPTGTWLLLPWMPSARNVRDAARTLARSKKASRTP